MITAVNTMLSDKLTKAGFDVYEEYSAAKPLKAGVYTALWRTERLILGEYRQAANANSKCSAAVKVNIRLLGGKKNFDDAAVLQSMAHKAGELYFSSPLAVISLTCGAPKRNAALGRLEQVIEAEYTLAIKKEDLK